MTKQERVFPKRSPWSRRHTVSWDITARWSIFLYFPKLSLKATKKKKIQQEKRENCPCTFGPVNKACNRRAAQLKMVTDEWMTGNGCYWWDMLVFALRQTLRGRHLWPLACYNWQVVQAVKCLWVTTYRCNLIIYFRPKMLRWFYFAPLSTPPPAFVSVWCLSVFVLFFYF